MENEKLEKLKKVLELLKEDTISPAKLTQIVSVLVETVKKSTENNEKLSTEMKETFRQVLDLIDEEHGKAIDSLKSETDKRVSLTEKQATEALRAAQEAMREIKSLVIPEEVDREEIIEEALKRVPKIEIPEAEKETGDSIVSKINDLPEDGEKIDASHIKNLPTPQRGGFGGMVVRELVAGTGITIDNSKPGYPEITATGSGTGDMTKEVYDPTEVGGDAFDMDNMAEGTATKIMTADERTKLSAIAEGAEVNVQADWNQATNTADDYIKNKPSIPAAYTLPTAAAGTLGGIKVGARLTITDGVLAADEQGGSYTLPTATDSILGGVKVGSGLSITEGVLAVTGGSMVYPGAGIPLSTGEAWGDSITNNSANWNTAYGWGNHASAGYVTGTPWTAMGYLTALTGAVLTDQTTPQTIGLTGARLAMLWATDITCTNAIAGSITGNAGTVTNGVTATSVIADNAIVRGDGGAKGVQTSLVTIDDNGNLFGDATSSSTSSPVTIGFNNFASFGRAARFQFGDTSNAIQNANSGAQQVYSYHRLELSGGRQSGPPSFFTGTKKGLGLNDVQTMVDGTRDDSVTFGVQGNSATQTTNLQNWYDYLGNVLAGINNKGSLLLRTGTATAGTAPLKLTAGVVNTTPEAGAIEFDGTDYFLTI